MPHRRLRDSRRYARHPQHRAERVSQSVNIDRAASVIAFRDAGRLQDAVENLAERLGDVEQLQRRRVLRLLTVENRQRVSLRAGPDAQHPLPQFVGNSLAKRNRIPLPVFFVGRVQPDLRTIRVKVKLPDGQRSQFVLSQSRRHGQLVNQLSPRCPNC